MLVTLNQQMYTIKYENEYNRIIKEYINDDEELHEWLLEFYRAIIIEGKNQRILWIQ
jgi:urocanate hydratase